MRFTAIGLFLIALACAGGGCASSQKPVASAAAAQVEDTPLNPSEQQQLEQAVQLMDEGKLEQSIAMLETLRKNHPHHASILHELALAQRFAKRPDRAVEILWPYRDSLSAASLAGLGSALHESGKKQQAEELLRNAIKRFPKSGLLYSELGTTLRGSGKYDEAAELYQRGIDVEPAAPSNYLHLAVMYAHSNAPGLTLFYGESFRVLEPETERSSEVGQLMVQVCRDNVKLEKGQGNEMKGHITLAPSVTIEKPEQVANLPFVNVLELTFGLGLVEAHQHGLSLASLHQARKAFLNNIRKPDSPFAWDEVPLYRWLKELDSAGHLEVYDYWLYGPGFPEEAKSFAETHAAAANAFAAYMGEHPLFR